METFVQNIKSISTVETYHSEFAPEEQCDDRMENKKTEPRIKRTGKVFVHHI